MKKLILAAFALTTAASVFAQGTIAFNNRIVGTIVTHVYQPLAGDSGFSQIGNGTADFTAGATNWAGFTGVGVALAGQYGANTTFAQLLGGPGVTPEASLVPATPITTFRSGAGAAGFIAATTATLTGVTADAATATLEMVAWDNSSGLYANWTLADVAWKAGLIAAGKSGTFGVGPVGGTGTPANLIGLQSFNLYFIPEPSTFALAGLGLAALVAFRRRNS